MPASSMFQCIVYRQMLAGLFYNYKRYSQTQLRTFSMLKIEFTFIPP